MRQAMCAHRRGDDRHAEVLTQQVDAQIGRGLADQVLGANRDTAKRGAILLQGPLVVRTRRDERERARIHDPLRLGFQIVQIRHHQRTHHAGCAERGGRRRIGIQPYLQRGGCAFGIGRGCDDLGARLRHERGTGHGTDGRGLKELATGQRGGWHEKVLLTKRSRIVSENLQAACQSIAQINNRGQID